MTTAGLAQKHRPIYPFHNCFHFFKPLNRLAAQLSIQATACSIYNIPANSHIFFIKVIKSKNISKLGAIYIVRKQVTMGLGSILENIEMLKPQLVQAIPSIENFIRYCQIHEVKAKSSIIKDGEPSESLYFILEGSVTVLLEDEDGREMVASYLNPGDFFGEMGLYGTPQCRSKGQNGLRSRSNQLRAISSVARPNARYIIRH